MRIQLNRNQRITLITIAALVSIIQLGGIAENGLDESRGWVWAFALAAILLFIALNTSSTLSDRERESPRDEKPPTRVMELAKQNIAAATRAVNHCEAIAGRLYSFVVANGLYHQVGPLAWMMHPAIQSGLVAHALVVLALEESKMKPDVLVWGTYRTTLAHRLAQRRNQIADAAGLTKEEQNTLHLGMVKGEIDLIEGIARRAVQSNSDKQFSELLQHVTATFGGRKQPADEERFIPLLSELYAETKSKILPVLSTNL